MGSAALGVSGMIVRARRRVQMRRAAEGIVDSIMPSVADAVGPSDRSSGDEAHARGHQHVPPTADEPVRHAAAAATRTFAKHQRGLRHPGRR
jgi:hypothetical protein